MPISSRVGNGFGKLLNVNKEEWPRILLAWFMSFFYRGGFVIGWTIIVGMFVGRYGIFWLPALFIANGIFTMIGSFIYSNFIDKHSKERIMFTSLLGAVVFLSAAALIGSETNLFFALMILAEAIFLVQMKITMNGFVETLFTPLESERTFPIIESAETIGGILAGLLVISLSGVIDPEHFIFIWMFLLLMVIPCLMYYKKYIRRVCRLNLEEENQEHLGLFDKLQEVFTQARHVAFVKGLIFVVFLQWVFANLIEFQYTKAVTQNVSAAVLNSGSGFEHALVHDLGALFILFSLSALLIQLFVGSRLITSLGIIGSMLIYPAVMILSVLGLTVRFSYPAAVLAQTNQTIAYVLYLNSYHSAYYSVREHYREHIREFLEGFIRPIGAVIGTSVIFGLQYYFVGKDLTLSVNLTMIAVLLILMMVMYSLQGNYTKLAVHNLLRAENKMDRIDAIGILSQRGHKNTLPVLTQVLSDPNESEFVKVKVLEALGELRDFDAIDAIISTFDSRKIGVRLAAVNALMRYKKVHVFFGKHVFHEYRMIESLKKLYKSEKNEEVRSLIIHLLSKLNPVGTFGFLLDILKSAKGNLKIDVIIALGRYRDEQIVPYLKPFLSSRSYMEKAATMIALWHFNDYKDDIEHNTLAMIKNSNVNSKCAGFHVVGELKFKGYRKYCDEALKSKDLKLRYNAALSLAKMGYLESVKDIVEMLFEAHSLISVELKRSLNRLPHKTRKIIEKEVKLVVSGKINYLLDKLHIKSLEHVQTKHLKYLKILYSLVNENEEVELINELLYSKC